VFLHRVSFSCAPSQLSVIKLHPKSDQPPFCPPSFPRRFNIVKILPLPCFFSTFRGPLGRRHLGSPHPFFLWTLGFCGNCGDGPLVFFSEIFSKIPLDVSLTSLNFLGQNLAPPCLLFPGFVCAVATHFEGSAPGLRALDDRSSQHEAGSLLL